MLIFYNLLQGGICLFILLQKFNLSTNTLDSIYNLMGFGTYIFEIYYYGTCDFGSYGLGLIFGFHSFLTCGFGPCAFRSYDSGSIFGSHGFVTRGFWDLRFKSFFVGFMGFWDLCVCDLWL